MAEEFERGEMYQLPPLGKRTGKELEYSAKHLRARFLFGEGINYHYLSSLFQDGWELKSTKLSVEYNFADMRKHYNEKIIPLFLVKANRKLFISTLDNPIDPLPGDTVISLVMS